MGSPRSESDILPVLEYSQLRPVVIYRRFGIVCRSHLQMSSNLVIEDGTDRLFRNVGKYQSKLHNIQEERISRF